MVAVVPTYRPDDALLTGLRALAPQVDSILVVDDGSPDHSSRVLEWAEELGFTVLRNPRNEGIAATLNCGIRLALADGADYVLTIDQDTVLPGDYVANCLAAFGLAPPATRLGVVCTDRVNGEPSIPHAYTAQGLGLVREAIQSGFLISSQCLIDCGLFDERLFIDCVDTEFCLRISLHGYSIAVGPGTDIIHSLGEKMPLRPFGIARFDESGNSLTYEYHGPVRRYFIARNNVDLWFRFARNRPRWVLSAIKRELGPTWTTIICGPQRRKQLLATVIGTTHGLARRRGPLGPLLRRILAG